MSQDYTVNSFQTDHVAQTDMANIEKNLECLRSFFSGASAPSNAVAGHPWFDTAQNLPKIRNDANSAWLAVLTGTIYQKLWIYRNDSDDGWAIDASVTDRVISLKGGSGLYDRTGGGVAGETWANLKAHVHDGIEHTHQWYDESSDTDDDKTYDSAGAEKDVGKGDVKAVGGKNHIQYSETTDNGPTDSYTKIVSGGDNTGAQSTADVRPAAAVGTLQYPDI